MEITDIHGREIVCTVIARAGVSLHQCLSIALDEEFVCNPFKETALLDIMIAGQLVSPIESLDGRSCSIHKVMV